MQLYECVKKNLDKSFSYVKDGYLKEAFDNKAFYTSYFDNIEGVEKIEEDGFTVYKYMNNDKPVAAMFYGKTQKPNFHASFRDEEQRDAYIDEFLKGKEEHNKRVAERREARKVTKDHNVKVGDIYYTMWGYDQTNVDFYEVVAVRGSRIDLRELSYDVVETYPTQEKIAPEAGSYVSDIKTVSARADGTLTPIDGRSFLSLSKWDGRPIWQTDSYSGH